jgi:hypothetical protein
LKQLDCLQKTVFVVKNTNVWESAIILSVSRELLCCFSQRGNGIIEPLHLSTILSVNCIRSLWFQ